jgi:tRNA dimethylallyltransferase
MQVYRYMDIGTAKPSREMLATIPHHLIDVSDPDSQFSVGDFVRRADDLVQRIIQRGRRPVVAGGTAFYIKSFAYGLSEAPRSKSATRRSVQEWIDRVGMEEAYSELQRIDPSYAWKIGMRDRSRMVRAFEVYWDTGKNLSSFAVPGRLRTGYEFLFIGLMRPRKELYARIDGRVDQMFEAGLYAEVKDLLKRGYDWGSPGMRGIGYREFSLFQKGCVTIGGLKELIQRNSRRYAKRQITFFRSLPGVRWFYPEDSGLFEACLNGFYGGC